MQNTTLNATPETATVSSGGQSEMTLLNMTAFPPKGWVYFEPSLNWRNPEPLNGEGISYAAKLLQIVRAQNPAANLDPSYAACLEAIRRYTCHRLKYDSRWCGLPPAEAQKQSAAYPSTRRGCASCGRR